MSAAELREAADRLGSDEDLADLDAYIPRLCDTLADWLDAQVATALARRINGGAS